MCFIKAGDAKIAGVDIFILKLGRALPHEFESRVKEFTYKRGKIYEKGRLLKWIGKRKKVLSREVYHCFDQHYSWYTARYNYSDNWGVFRIPKGTTFFENEGSEEIATFAIEYIAPLTELTREVILQQKSLHEIVQMAERKAANVQIL